MSGSYRAFEQSRARVAIAGLLTAKARISIDMGALITGTLLGLALLFAPGAQADNPDPSDYRSANDVDAPQVPEILGIHTPDPPAGVVNGVMDDNMNADMPAFSNGPGSYPAGGAYSSWPHSWVATPQS